MRGSGGMSRTTIVDDELRHALEGAERFVSSLPGRQTMREPLADSYCVSVPLTVGIGMPSAE